MRINTLADTIRTDLSIENVPRENQFGSSVMMCH